MVTMNKTIKQVFQQARNVAAIKKNSQAKCDKHYTFCFDIDDARVENVLESPKISRYHSNVLSNSCISE
jgi:hypothetical protein